MTVFGFCCVGRGCVTFARVQLLGFVALVSASLCFASPIFAKTKRAKRYMHILMHTHGHAKVHILCICAFVGLYAYAKHAHVPVY